MPEPLPVVGRAAEQKVLRKALAAASAGHGGVVLIDGEAGIGKSRLATLAIDAAQSLGFACFDATASERTRHRPFGVIADALGFGNGAGRAPEMELALGAGAALAPVGSHGLHRLDGPGGSRATDGLPSESSGPPAEVAALIARLATLVSGDSGHEGSFLLTGAPEAEFRIIDDLTDLVELQSARRPMLLVLEDLHWADPSTLLALNRLLRELPALACLVVGTMRTLTPGADRRSLREQLVARGAVPLRLRRLSDGEVGTLVANVLGAPPGPRLLQQLHRAGGNPFFATELVDALDRGGALLRYGGVAELSSDEVLLPESVSNAIVHRVSFISEEILETLQVASILGPAFSVTELAVSTGRKPAALSPLLAAAVRAGILGEDGTRLAFRHDLIREVLYQRMDPALRSWIHLAVAHVLEERGHPQEEVAGHVARGAQPGDQNAAQLLRTAARHVAPRSSAVAAELLVRAIEVAPAGSHDGAAARADLAGYRLQTGRHLEAEAICRELIDGGMDPSLEGQVRCCLVEAIIGRGRLGEGLAEIESAIGSPALNDSYRARLLSLASTCRASTWDPDGAFTAAVRALKTAEQAGDDIGCGVALSNLSVVNTLRGNYQEAVDLAESGLARVNAGTGRRTQPFLPVLTLASALVDADRPAEAQQVLQRWRRERMRAGAGWNHPVDHIISGIGRFWSGEWDEALASLSLSFDIAETTEVRRGAVAGHAVASMIALHRGDLATAEHEVAAAEADYESTAPQWRADWMFWARALRTEAEGRRAEALRTLVKAWELCRGAGVVSEYPVIGPDLVRLALACGDRLLAEEATTALEELAAHAGVAGIQGAALRCRGLCSGDPAVLLEAVAAYRRSPRRRALGLTCEDAAVALARQAGARETGARQEVSGGGGTGCPPSGELSAAAGSGELLQQADDLAAEALAVFRSLDARRDLARAQARLKAAGLTRAPSPRAAGAAVAATADMPRGHPTLGLTPKEAQVASHVAQGLSNRQIAELLEVSPRTVQSHISNALHKLKLASRVELALWTSERHPGSGQ